MQDCFILDRVNIFISKCFDFSKDFRLNMSNLRYFMSKSLTQNTNAFWGASRLSFHKNNRLAFVSRLFLVLVVWVAKFSSIFYNYWFVKYSNNRHLQKTKCYNSIIWGNFNFEHNYIFTKTQVYIYFQIKHFVSFCVLIWLFMQKMGIFAYYKS